MAACPCATGIGRAHHTFRGTHVDSLVTSLNNIIWSPALIYLCLGAGLYFSIRTRFLQVRGVIRVEDRDGAHDRSCQKPAQS